MIARIESGRALCLLHSRFAIRARLVLHLNHNIPAPPRPERRVSRVVPNGVCEAVDAVALNVGWRSTGLVFRSVSDRQHRRPLRQVARYPKWADDPHNAPQIPLYSLR
jgi:hypothetical protein